MLKYLIGVIAIGSAAFMFAGFFHWNQLRTGYPTSQIDGYWFGSQNLNLDDLDHITAFGGAVTGFVLSEQEGVNSDIQQSDVKLIIEEAVYATDEPLGQVDEFVKTHELELSSDTLNEDTKYFKVDLEVETIEEVDFRTFLSQALDQSLISVFALGDLDSNFELESISYLYFE